MPKTKRKAKSATRPSDNSIITKAVVLAAGRGKRMRELTDAIPKPMVEIRGRPLLAYIIEGLREAAIERVLLIVGYRKEVIIDYFGNGADFGIQIEYVEQTTQDGTGRVVKLAKNFTSGSPFILSYGDTLVDPSVYRTLTRLGEAEMLLTVRRMTDLTQGGAVYLNKAFEVVDLREKQAPGETHTPWYNAGVYAFRSSIFYYISRLQKSPRGEYELTDAIRAVAQARRLVRAVEIAGRWADVRDPEILAELNLRSAV
jgi:NDP-sugar pyrophosphorylase family protein